MIASLKGVIDAISKDSMIINVNGIGFKLSVPTSVLSELGVVGREIKLYTHMHVREDDLSLYGFGSLDELRLFETLISVSGLGPKTAMGMLSAMSEEASSSAPEVTVPCSRTWVHWGEISCSSKTSTTWPPTG